MFRIFCKNLSQNLYRAQGLTRNLETHSLKSNSNSPNQYSPIVSYLINSCGLSLKPAISASQKIHFETTEKADSVLQLFKAYGFTNEQITNLITKYPRFLLADADKSLKPKLEYYESLGFSRPDLSKLICSDKSLLLHSVEKRIIPIVTFLRSFLPTNEELTTALKNRSSRIFGSDVQFCIKPNILALKAVGVPDSNISRLLRLSTKAVAVEFDVFKPVVGAIKKLGFDPRSPSFVLAVSTLCQTGKSCWEKKVRVLNSFGWSSEDVVLAFKSQPMFMLSSEKKIKLLMDVYVNKLGIEPSDLAKCPNLFLVSLEKRIIPRCSVLQILLSKGLIQKDFNMISVFNLNKMTFEKRFLTKYKETAPEVVEAYEGEMGYLSFETFRLIS